MSRLIAEELHGRGMTTEIIKIALPLYRLQQHLYASAGRHVGLWTHDNELLRLLATQLRRINPDFLADDFLTRMRASRADDRLHRGGPYVVQTCHPACHKVH
ncbi:hypothetical protein [Actinoplanes xinjiangensis]|uniref:Uncharacterized protein n=1 Tax=Actinoplanes xinjiangensis TaxID=512350 RepID=A0A316EXI9_9ACTN|nr:hypothetical protein [Actinoplanes xinjiangensis]PWK36069.1 hypothetical protein BC793_12450 [Actinoplanes xinjiangensis]GIF42928.1 hypothetical protein Axi01nite_72390 [Actinoplanes xinjiangensis]